MHQNVLRFGTNRAPLIHRAGQQRDFPLGQLGREPLQTNVGKTDRRYRATGGNGQRCKTARPCFKGDNSAQ